MLKKPLPQIFDAIVEQAIRHGLVDGTVLYTDSTHLKANANKNRYDLAVVARSRSDYWDALDVAIEEDRAAHGKKPLKEKPRAPVEKETKVSRTDPDAGYMVRDGKRSERPTGRPLYYFRDIPEPSPAVGVVMMATARPPTCVARDWPIYGGALCAVP